MLNWKHMLMGTTVALTMIAAPAIAQEVNAWDADADGSITEEEFGTGFGDADVFGEWDTDDDDALSEDEFSAGIGDATDTFNERFGEGAFTEWDEDGDGTLAEDEFRSGAYAGYDDDADDVIEEPELSDLGDDIGDGGFWDV